MNIIFKKFVYMLGVCLLPIVSQAASITFDFTGRLVVVDPYGNVMQNEVDGSLQSYTPIEASLTFDTNTELNRAYVVPNNSCRDIHNC